MVRTELLAFGRLLPYATHRFWILVVFWIVGAKEFSKWTKTQFIAWLKRVSGAGALNDGASNDDKTREKAVKKLAAVMTAAQFVIAKRDDPRFETAISDDILRTAVLNARDRYSTYRVSSPSVSALLTTSAISDWFARLLRRS